MRLGAHLSRWKRRDSSLEDVYKDNLLTEGSESTLCLNVLLYFPLNEVLLLLYPVKAKRVTRSSENILNACIAYCLFRRKSNIEVEKMNNPVNINPHPPWNAKGYSKPDLN